MRKIFFLFFLFCSCSIFGQYRPDKVKYFSREIDSVILRAKKERFHQVTINISSYSSNLIDSQDNKSRDSSSILWTKVINDGEFGESNMTFTFLNDSVVEQDMDGKKYFGIIKDGKIGDDKRLKVESDSIWNHSEKDSLGFKISERWIGKDKEKFFVYYKSVYNSKGFLIETWSFHQGKIASCQTFENHGDTVYLVKTYMVPHNPSSNKKPCLGCDSAKTQTFHLNTLFVADWKVWQNDSLALILEASISRKFRRDNRSAVDSVITVSYDIYSNRKPLRTKNTSNYSYVYDNSGKLINAEMIAFQDGLGLIWKDEMAVIYKK